jgi:hypothetical protein
MVIYILWSRLNLACANVNNKENIVIQVPLSNLIVNKTDKSWTCNSNIT